MCYDESPLIQEESEALERETAESAPCKLNNEKKAKAPEISLRVAILLKNESVKRHKSIDQRCAKALEKSSEKDFEQECLRYHFLESLILAQDERWRRA